MGNEYRAKVFKSGNSVALRLPKSWGFRAGEEVGIVSRAEGGFEVRRLDNAADALMDLYGSFSKDFMADGRGEIDQADRGWDYHPDPKADAA